MQFSIVINTRNRKEMLFALLESLIRCEGGVGCEYIVIDDFSDEDFSEEVHSRYPFVQFVRNITRQYLINSRNAGWNLSKNSWVLFIDDDNEIKDEDFLIKAGRSIITHPEAGIVGGRTYYYDYPETIMVGPTKFNKFTGKTTFLGANKKDTGKLEGLIETNDVPNVFFVSRAVLDKVGGFSPEIFQTFSEADFAEKVRRIGLKVYQSSDLKVYHKSEPPDFKKMDKRQMGGSPERFYFLMRNRFVFLKKWGNTFQKITFTLLFSHLYTVFYLLALVRRKEYKMVRSGLMGVLHGYIYMFSGKLLNLYVPKN